MTLLRRRTIDYMLLLGYAASTIKSYLNHISHFASYFKVCPSTLNQEDVKVFLSYLLKEKNYTQSSLNGAYGAIKILFVHVLEKPWDTNVKTQVANLLCAIKKKPIELSKKSLLQRKVKYELKIHHVDLIVHTPFLTMV